MRGAKRRLSPLDYKPVLHTFSSANEPIKVLSVVSIMLHAVFRTYNTGPNMLPYRIKFGAHFFMNDSEVSSNYVNNLVIAFCSSWVSRESINPVKAWDTSRNRKSNISSFLALVLLPYSVPNASIKQVGMWSWWLLCVEALCVKRVIFH